MGVSVSIYCVEGLFYQMDPGAVQTLNSSRIWGLDSGSGSGVLGLTSEICASDLESEASRVKSEVWNGIWRLGSGVRNPWAWTPGSGFWGWGSHGI